MRLLAAAALFLRIHYDEQDVEVVHSQDLLQPPPQPRRRAALPPHQLGHVPPGDSAPEGEIVLGDVQFVQQFPNGGGVERDTR